MLDITIQLTSQTYANKAYRTLCSRGVRCQMVKIEGRRGCAHGVAVSRYEQNYALSILSSYGIRVDDVF